MVNNNPAIKFFITIGKTQSILNNRFDRGLGGLGFNEFLILYYLDQAEDQKLRRVDLADKVGMTPSGVTRLLLPMEKVHYVESGPAEEDARVRFVSSTAAGREKLKEALERLEVLAEDFISAKRSKELVSLTDLLIEIGGRVAVR